MTLLYQQFEQTVRCFASKIAIITEQKQYSYQELFNKTLRWANFLSAKSKSSTVRLGLLTEEAINTAALSLAMAKINATCVPCNPQLTVTQLIDGWTATDVNIVVYEPAFEHKITQCKKSTQTQQINFIPTDIISTQDQSKLSTTTQQNIDITTNNKDFIITLSSGSTGSPKPIVISQQVKLKRAQQSWQLYNITADDVVLCVSPFFHSLGQRLFFVPLLLGCTLVHLKQFTPKAWLSAVEQFKVSTVISVSSHLYALKEFLLTNTTQLNSLKTIVTSSAPIDAHFKAQLFKTIGCDFHEMYGATEVATVSNLSPTFAQQQYTSVGDACAEVTIKIVDDKHQPIDNGQIGEIAVKTPLAFSRYYKRDELTAEATHNGFFLTGDLGKIAEDGFLTYVGRKKDIIISGGINIYPKDIEAIISTQPDIKEVAVIGVNDNFLGEVIIAICIINNNKVNDNSIQGIEKELYRLANKNLAPFQRPLKYLFPEALPLTASGKTSKLDLREQYNQLNIDWSAPIRALLFR